ncbi:MAG TPA: hypothetical protein VK797_13175 [Tepidisphaeraceae bacterium]|nr:hypothetical protein [Tepidisphaeraceae bacterium]
MLRKRQLRKAAGGTARNGAVGCELLERRLLLSDVPGVGAAHPMFVAAHPTVNGRPFSSSVPPASATTPSQMRHFYGVDAVNFGGITGDGRGETIAIVDTFDDPNASSDLKSFDAFYGLPAPPSFLQYNESGQLLQESGGTGLAPGKGRNGNGWQVEESLDIEWAHVIAPAAKIALVECNSTSFTDLFAGVTAAAGITNVVCVSMSWGSNGEFSGENSNDSGFTASGITYLAATGDSGDGGTSYPAASVNVVAVGGTSIHFASGTTNGSYGSETAWSGTGGELSPYEPKPSYQNAVLGGSERGTPDVSMDADPNTGVAIYDSYDFGASTPWAQYGGTSLSTPMWAGLVAIADQGRAGASLAPLSGASQTLPALYSASATNFHDVTSGSNGPGNVAGPGYDTVTGIGTPNAATLLNAVSGVAAGFTQLAFTAPPAATVAGVAIDSPTGVQVAVQNQSGMTIATDSSTVTLQLNGGTFAGGATQVMATAMNGVATFSGLVIDAAGSYTLTATDGMLTPLTSASFSVTPASSGALAFGVGPGAATAGNAISPAVTVDVEDAFGNLVTTDGSTVTVTLSAGTFSNGLATATAPAMGGVATFGGLVINTAGSYTLMASDGSLTNVASASFNVGPAGSSMLVFAVGPGNGTTGAAIIPTVTVDVEDAFGNLVTNDGSTVTLTLSTGTFSTSSAIATALAQSGVAGFSGLTINNAGSYTLTASDGTLIPANSSSFTVTLIDAINSSKANTTTLRQDPDGQHIDWSSGNAFGAIPINDVNGLTVNGDGGSDVIALNYTNGDPLPNSLHLNSNGTGTLTIDNLQGANPLAGVTLDIGSSIVYIHYGSSDPVATILSYLRSGYNNGAWNGTPTSLTGVITSSAAQNEPTHNTTIGYADSSDGQGFNTVPNTIELKYTLYGDDSLNGQVDSLDLQVLLSNLNRAGGWDQGDFNYDGVVNSADLQMLLNGLNHGLATQPAAAAVGAATTSEQTPSSPIPKPIVSVVPPSNNPSQPHVHTARRVIKHW